MCLRYSSSVVAPIACSSPRASIGLSMLAASIAPSARPAPTTVCSSSMKRMISPSDSWTSLRTAFSRSSNSPRNFAPGDQRAHVERDDPLVLQPLGHVAAHDPLGQPFGDRGLADARLADQHRVVLGPAREHLDDAANLLITADHRVELAVTGRRGQVAAILLERRIGAFRVRRRHALIAANALEQFEDTIAHQATLCQQPCRLALRRQNSEQQMLGADVFVAKLARLLLGGVEHLASRAGDGCFGAVLE